MKLNRISEKKIEITSDLEVIPDDVLEEARFRQWIGNRYEKTGRGFTASIFLPLHTIVIEATIITRKKDKLEFLWNSEYVGNQSLVSIHITGTSISVTEVGDFGHSRWEDPAGIHLDIWKNAIERLEKILMR